MLYHNIQIEPLFLCHYHIHPLTLNSLVPSPALPLACMKKQHCPVTPVYVCIIFFSEAANMSDVDSRSGIYILVKQICGVKNEKKREQSYIAKGELLVEIPPKERVAQQQDVPPHNYCLLRNPNVTLYDTGVNVSPLFGAQADYLEGITDPNARILEYRKEPRLKWIMNLRQCDSVFFKLEGDKSNKVPLHSSGKIKYYGAIKGRYGVMFGIEITVS